MTVTPQQFAAFVSRFDSLAARGEDVELVKLVNQLTEDETQFLLTDENRRIVAETANDRLARHEVKVRQEADQQESEMATKRPSMTVLRAVDSLKKQGLNDEALVIKNGWKTVQARDKDELINLLEVINDLYTLTKGRLREFLFDAAEIVTGTLLELMVERFQEADRLFQKSRKATGQIREGLVSDAVDVRNQINTRLPVSGLKAIQRLMDDNRLPDGVKNRLSEDAIVWAKGEKRPACTLIWLLGQRPADRKNSSKFSEEPMRPGKTARKPANAESARRARQLKRAEQQPQGIQGQKAGVGQAKPSQRAANDPNARSKKGKRRK